MFETIAFADFATAAQADYIVETRCKKLGALQPVRRSAHHFVGRRTA